MAHLRMAGARRGRNAVGVRFGHREDNRLAGQLARLILEASLHDFLPLLAEGIFVADLDFDLGARVVGAVGGDTLLGESVPVLLAKVHALYAFALETGMRLVEAEIDKELFLYGLWVVVEERWRIGVAAKEPEGITVDEVGGCRSQADHAGIKVLDDFGEPFEERAVRFIENDEIEESWAELGVAERQRLLGGDEKAFGFVDLMCVNSIARLMRQMGFEAVCQSQVDERGAVREEQ